MASGAVAQHTRSEIDSTESTLLNLLSNDLILRLTAPQLPPSSLVALAATSKDFRALIQQTPGVFRHLDITSVKAAQFDIDVIDRGGETWRNVQVDENLTEDDFYSGPLRGIFYNLRKQNILRDVQTLVLDGLSVTADLAIDSMVDPSFAVKILSLRECKNLNEHKLMQSLRYVCRPSRLEGTPRLKALYIFGKKDAPALPAAATSVNSSGPPTPSSSGAGVYINWLYRSEKSIKAGIEDEEGDAWYQRKGRMITGKITNGWAETLASCRESIAFDAVLCTSPRHHNSPAFGNVPVRDSIMTPCNIATFALPGCATCGTAPEGFTVHGESPVGGLPVLAPLPLHSSNVKVAQQPQPSADGEGDEKPKFIPRCWECIKERYCLGCEKWWCESCYQIPTREELEQGTTQLQIVDNDANGLDDHEAAATALPKPKVRRGVCESCSDKYSHDKRFRNEVTLALGALALQQGRPPWVIYAGDEITLPWA